MLAGVGTGEKQGGPVGWLDQGKLESLPSFVTWPVKSLNISLQSWPVWHSWLECPVHQRVSGSILSLPLTLPFSLELTKNILR